MSSIKVGVILLCRYNSSRLPGKILKKINGKEIISYILERLLLSVPKDHIVIACSTSDFDDKIAVFAEKNGYSCYRGSLDNVSLRFYNALVQSGWDYGIRINGDNIFSDPEVLNDMIHVASNGQYSFLSNVKDRTFPKGMSVEIVQKKYYEKHLDKIVHSEYHKEHVMSYFYTMNEESNYFHFNDLVPEARAIQFALDTEEDLKRTQWMMDKMNREHTEYGLAELFSLYNEYVNEQSL